MRYGIVLAAVLLPLSGCYVAPPPQPNYGYAAPSGPPPGYDAYAQPGYPPPGYDPSAAPYQDYSYNGGSPTMMIAGAAVPLVVVGGSWGYYDANRGWHRAPDQVNREVERQRAAGAVYHPGGEGYPQGRPPGAPPGGYPQGRPPGAPPGGYPQVRPAGGPDPYHGQPQYRPPPQQVRPAPEHEEHEHNRNCPPGQRC